MNKLSSATDGRETAGKEYSKPASIDIILYMLGDNEAMFLDRYIIMFGGSLALCFG